MPRSGKIVNKKGLAEIFGISTQAIDGWLARGCPYLEKGAPLVGYKFDTAQVAEWKSQQAVEEAISSSRPGDEDDALKRKTSAEATLAELRLHRELGQLVTLEDVERVWSKLTASCRARLLSVPSKVASVVISASSADLARTVIESAIAEALDELGSTGIDEPDGMESALPAGASADSDAEAASEAEPEPVGGRKTKAEPGSKRRARAVDNGAR